jgi:hypothetical protein
MLLGFSYLYRSAAYRIHHGGSVSRLGYLSENELDKACKTLVPRSMRAQRAVLAYCRQSAAALVLMGIFGSALAVGAVSSKWDAYQIALAEQRESIKKIPARYERMTLIGASASPLASVTHTFRVDNPRDYALPASLENVIRKDICAKKLANIKKGVAYYYEFQRLSGEPIAQIKIDSCP